MKIGDVASNTKIKLMMPGHGHLRRILTIKFKLNLQFEQFDLARTYLQLPLRQWGAGNVYPLVLSS
jgi:hypothetical protein